MRKNRKVIAALCAIGAVLGVHAERVKNVALSESDQIQYDAIFAPKAVAVPPWFAQREMCVATGGEVRHFGRTVIGGEARRAYIYSRDLGLSWKTVVMTDDSWMAAMVKSPWSDTYLCMVDSWFTKDVICPELFARYGKGKTLAVRSPTGSATPVGASEVTAFVDPKFHFFRNPTPLRHRKRWICAGQGGGDADGTYIPCVYISDDDGVTWRKTSPKEKLKRPTGFEWPDKKPRWASPFSEPSVEELPDGTIWLVCRTALHFHSVYKSSDGGETWGAPEKMDGFYADETNPCLFTLSDGRVVFVWNNTEALPEIDPADQSELGNGERNGAFEDVFTNRDVCHLAVSEDNGRTWHGFRELCRNVLRDRSDYRSAGESRILHESDKSVHQSQIVELPGGKIMVANGQHPAARRIYVLDLKWLDERTAREDFSTGLDGLSSFLYVKSWSGGNRGGIGHCNWNRVPGALLVPDPEGGKERPEALRIARIRDERLVSERQGVAWNFPALKAGRVKVAAKVVTSGVRMTVTDRWFNPCDETAGARSPVWFDITKEAVGEGWHDIEVVSDSAAKNARLVVDGRQIAAKPLAYVPVHGFSYLHLITLAEGHNPDGTLFRSFESME